MFMLIKIICDNKHACKYELSMWRIRARGTTILSPSMLNKAFLESPITTTTITTTVMMKFNDVDDYSRIHIYKLEFFTGWYLDDMDDIFQTYGRKGRLGLYINESAFECTEWLPTTGWLMRNIEMRNSKERKTSRTRGEYHKRQK